MSILFQKNKPKLLLMPALCVALIGGALLTSSSCAVAQIDAKNPRQNWGMTPLGPDAPALQIQPAAIKRPLQTHFKSLPATGEKLVLAQDKRAVATLVVPAGAKSRDSSFKAALLLQDVWQKISGAKIPIVSEDKLKAAATGTALVSLGATKLAAQANISAQDLLADGYRLQTQGQTLFIVGNDEGDGFAVNGTRNGAYALLERHFGYRKLWPGALGEVIHNSNLLTMEPINERDEPALPVRTMRNYYPTTRVPHPLYAASALRLNRSMDSFASKGQDSDDWFDAMKLGRSTVYRYGHAFNDLWEEQGKAHPEFFALQPDGSRDQAKAKSAHRPRLDVSNPQLIELVAADAIRKFREDLKLSSVSISPADGGPAGFCMCEVCRRLDPPNAPKITANFGAGHGRDEYVSLSDRYVTFYGKIAEIVGKEFPDRMLGAYAYSAYRTPPLHAKLPPNVLIGFVGLNYFNEEQRQTNLQDWDGWTRAANRLLLRPNALIAGHGLPAIYAHKLGADVQHCYQTGMVAADFDSVMHNWGGQGVNYYVLAKLLWDPSQNVDALIVDYCDQGFGKASPAIQKYYAALEDLTNRTAAAAGEDSANEEDAIASSPFYRSLSLLADNYTDDQLDRLQKLLEDAKVQAAGDKTVVGRIDFLAQSLRYARAEIAPVRLFMQLQQVAFEDQKPEKKAELLRLLKARQDVFQDIYDNHFYAQNVLYPFYRETSMWRPYGWNPGNEK